MAYKYDKEKLKELQENVQIGMTDENSAVLAFGIGRSTYYEWTSENSPLTKEEKSDLLLALEKGRAIRNMTLVKEIRLATEKGDGKLALDLLKRLERKTYGDKLEQSNVNKNLNVDASSDKPVKEQVDEIINGLEDLQKFIDE